MDDKTNILRKTPHYTFTLNIKKETNFKSGEVTSHALYVGDIYEPCLHIQIVIQKSDERLPDSILEEANLIKIKSIRSCIINRIDDELYNKESFSIEMLNSVLEYITNRPEYNKVKRIKLDDKSYIPCKDETEILELLTYSIALYGKTWYEKVYNAYLPDKQDFMAYRNRVEMYMSEPFKKEYVWDLFYSMYIENVCSEFTKKFITSQYSTFETIFTESKTFPEFFKKINTLVKREDKCSFYKFWLYMFINESVKVERVWVFDLKRPKIGGKKRRTKRKLHKLSKIKKSS
jgi:hypothetical protein